MSSVYIVVSKEDLNYSQIVADCEAKLRESNEDPGTILSVAELDKGDVMIKVPYTDKAWVQAQTWAAEVKFDFGPCEKLERIDYYEKEQVKAEVVVDGVINE